jgi:hypothetical protein
MKYSCPRYFVKQFFEKSLIYQVLALKIQLAPPNLNSLYQIIPKLLLALLPFDLASALFTLLQLKPVIKLSKLILELNFSVLSPILSKAFHISLPTLYAWLLHH